jgi:hypothetical protein
VTNTVFGDLQVSTRVKQVLTPLALLSNDRLQPILQQIAIQHEQAVRVVDFEGQFENAVTDALTDVEEIDMGRVARVGRSLETSGLAAFLLRDIVEKISPERNVGEHERDSVAKLGRFFRETEIQMERLTVSGEGKCGIVFIRRDHPLMSRRPTSLTNGPHGNNGPMTLESVL